MPDDQQIPRGGDDSPVAIPVDFNRAVTAFARHDAAKSRHLELLGRLRAASRDNAELRQSMERLRDHATSARAELTLLGVAVDDYARALRESGAPPERTIMAVKVAVNDALDRLPDFERPHDRASLLSDLTASAIEAYYGNAITTRRRTP